MGGDGGVVATNRRYMRGAGSADHTADAKRASAADKALAERESLHQKLRTCNISGSAFDFSIYHQEEGSKGNVEGASSEIVVCPLGLLYKRESAVEALIRRKGCDPESDSVDIGWHVRGLKDLHPVIFHVVKRNDTNSKNQSKEKDESIDEYILTCPLTGIEINGMQPAFVIVKEKKSGKSMNDASDRPSLEPNILSEKAIKEIGFDSLQEEYGPFRKEDMIRLVPPTGRILEEIKEQLEARRIEESSNKKMKKRKRSNKSKEGITSDDNKKSVKYVEKKSKTENSSSGIASVQKNVAAAVSSNNLYNSLFVSDKKPVSEKEHKDNLFAR